MFYEKWTIVYSDYSNMQKKAIELISREMGELVCRIPGKYSFAQIPCVTCDKEFDGSVIAIGKYDENTFIQKFVKKEEIPSDGYLVKVFDNPDDENLKIAIITAINDREVFYGAVDFIDDYFSAATLKLGVIKYTEKIFMRKLPDYTHASSPKIKTRSIFTWGHPINNYRTYIEKMARLKLNQLVLWNDYVPLNANEIVDYAHEYGIEVLWGFAWGWHRGCRNIDYNKLDELKQSVIEKYETEYANIKGDGIYFQSFTELRQDVVGDVIIADVVTKFVNDTANELLSRYPGLKIQFGLHALSVSQHIEYIAKTDKRVEIVWEDCGAFPFNYEIASDTENYEDTKQFIRSVVESRPNAPIGMYYKGQLCMEWMDWECGSFNHQVGPYIMGDETKNTIKTDADIVNPLWRVIQREFLAYGKKAYDMTNMLLEMTGGNINLGMAGQMSGDKIWYSYAFCSQLFWDSTEDYDKLVDRVIRRRNVCLD